MVGTYPSGTMLCRNLTNQEMTNIPIVIAEMLVHEFNKHSPKKIRAISGYPSRSDNPYLKEMEDFLNDLEIVGCERRDDDFVVLPQGSLGVLAQFKYDDLNDFKQTMIRKTP